MKITSISVSLIATGGAEEEARAGFATEQWISSIKKDFVIVLNGGVIPPVFFSNKGLLIILVFLPFSW
jgi:hypothetical protein